MGSPDVPRADLARDASGGASLAARDGSVGQAGGGSERQESPAQQGYTPEEPCHDGQGEEREQGEGQEGGEEEGGEGRDGKETAEEEREAHADELGEMPKTIVRRIVKAKLMSVLGKRGPAPEGGADANGQQKDVNISKDALVAFAESAKIFVHYVTALAHDWSVQGKRQTITAEDVLRGLEDAQLFEFIPQLQESLQTLRASKRSKRSKKSHAGTAKESALPVDVSPAQEPTADQGAVPDAPEALETN